MNGGHDLGGQHGFGPINAETDEPVFHADWEKRVFALVRAGGALGRWNSDMARHARERQHPADYLRHSYYENWLAGLEKLLVEAGVVTAAELPSGKSIAPASAKDRQRVLKAKKVANAEKQGSPATAPAAAPPRFQVGDQVRARNRHPAGHTREPRYVRGRIGVIEAYHGAHILPDESVAGKHLGGGTSRLGHHLYNVRFTASELWGESANGNSAVHVDLWEDYLEPA